MAFANEVQYAAVGVEAARVIHHDGRLADHAHEIERRGDGAITGLLAEDHLNQQHLLHGREEMDADELVGAL